MLCVRPIRKSFLSPRPVRAMSTCNSGYHLYVRSRMSGQCTVSKVLVRNSIAPYLKLYYRPCHKGLATQNGPERRIVTSDGIISANAPVMNNGCQKAKNARSRQLVCVRPTRVVGADIDTREPRKRRPCVSPPAGASRV
jgi:hypothetical protein